MFCQPISLFAFPFPSAQGARVVAFETVAEWTKVYNLLQANMAKSGKTQMSFWLNAGYDQNAEKFRWLTDGKGDKKV